MRYGKPDSNKAEIVEYFRKAGGFWKDFPPHFGCDGLLAIRGRVYLVEIKDGSKPPSRQKLTKNERDFAKALLVAGTCLYLVNSLSSAQALVEFSSGGKE